MRNVLYVVLAAAGLAGLVLLLRRSCCRRSDPVRRSERLIDSGQDTLERIQGAMRSFQQ